MSRRRGGKGDDEMPYNMDSSCTWCCGVEVPGGRPRGSGEDTTSWVDGAAQSPENVTWERHMEALPGYL